MQDFFFFFLSMNILLIFLGSGSSSDFRYVTRVVFERKNIISQPKINVFILHSYYTLTFHSWRWSWVSLRRFSFPPTIMHILSFEWNILEYRYSNENDYKINQSEHDGSGNIWTVFLRIRRVWLSCQARLVGSWRIPVDDLMIMCLNICHLK